MSSNNASLTDSERTFYKIESKSATQSIKSFFSVKKKQSASQVPVASIKSSAKDKAKTDIAVKSSTNANSILAPRSEQNTENAGAPSISSSPVGSLRDQKSLIRPTRHCQGVFRNFRPSSKRSMSAELKIYGENCIVGAKSNYRFDIIDTYYQVFSKDCQGDVCINRGTTKVAHWSCNSCHQLSRSSGHKLSQIIRERADKVTTVLSALNRKEELTACDYDDLRNFLRSEDKYWSERGLALRDKVREEINSANAIAKMRKTKSTSRY